MKKISEDVRKSIITARLEGKAIEVVAKHYGVSKSSVSRIAAKASAKTSRRAGIGEVVYLKKEIMQLLYTLQVDREKPSEVVHRVLNEVLLGREQEEAKGFFARLFQ